MPSKPVDVLLFKFLKMSCVTNMLYASSPEKEFALFVSANVVKTVLFYSNDAFVSKNPLNVQLTRLYMVEHHF